MRGLLRMMRGRRGDWLHAAASAQALRWRRRTDELWNRQLHGCRARAEGAADRAPFADIVCAVNGSRGSEVAARQAITLAMPDAALHFIAVSHTEGVGLSEMAELSEARAQKALEEAARLAGRVGVTASTELRDATSASETLLAESRRHDLLVVGSHGGSRAGGIFLGSTATRAAHETSTALLVARRSDGRWRDFPMRILLATDGSPGSWSAARATARIGAGSRLPRGPALRAERGRSTTTAHGERAGRRHPEADRRGAHARRRPRPRRREDRGHRARGAIVADPHRAARPARCQGARKRERARGSPGAVLGADRASGPGSGVARAGLRAPGVSGRREDAACRWPR